MINNKLAFRDTKKFYIVENMVRTESFWNTCELADNKSWAYGLAQVLVDPDNPVTSSAVETDLFPVIASCILIAGH